MQVLTWNLKHGRAEPSAGRELFAEFAAALGSWPWDAALLQEVPPWWPAQLADRLAVSEGHVLTSRNSLLALRRAVAIRWPDLIKSNGGGSNAILVRGRSIRQQRVRRVGWFPERRWVHAVELDGLWLGNLHLQASDAQTAAAASALLEWAGPAPAILGGDFNLRSPAPAGFLWAGGSGVDHVFVNGGGAAESSQVLHRGALSDHAPVLVRIAGL
jgi:endonuclease/exonuclease/phosphatase family metal-dependent hydrolase